MILSDIQDFIAAIAPEYETGLTVVNADLAGIPQHGECSGWVHEAGRIPGLDHQLGDKFQPGKVIGLCVDDIASTANPGRLDACLRNVAIHEVAHVLPKRPPFVPFTLADDELAVAMGAFRAAQTAPRGEVTGDVEGHNAEFCRRVVHLYHRAIRLGFDVAPDLIFGYLGTFHRWELLDYLPLLEAEANEYGDAPFDLIDRVPAPETYLDAWNHNRETITKRWRI